MRLRVLEVNGFRNLAPTVVELHPRLTVLHGPNGQGKTNLLEAIYWLATLRSFRTARLEELIQFEVAGCMVRARVERAGLERVFEVQLTVQPRQRRVRVDGKVVRSVAEYFGGFNVVLFVPEDLRLLRAGPAERRRYLDRAIWNAEPAYLAEAQRYEQVLRSRNTLLRGPRPVDRTQLDVYDEQLAEAGAVVMRRRRAMVARLGPPVEEAHARISGTRLVAALGYQNQLGDDLEDAVPRLRQALERSRSRDLERGFTGPGPHGDDLDVSLDGRPARLHASQGQTRALVLALKLAEIRQLAQALGEPPILLLDDVSAELDAEKVRLLFAELGDLAGQACLTTTQPAILPLPKEYKSIQVVNGHLPG